MEDNTNIIQPKTWKQPKIPISTILDPVLWKEAKESMITWNEAIELGVIILLADRDVREYPDCELLKKMWRWKEKYEDLLKEKEDGTGNKAE